jgi:hypothetical protein
VAVEAEEEKEQDQEATVAILAFPTPREIFRIPAERVAVLLPLLLGEAVLVLQKTVLRPIPIATL